MKRHSSAISLLLAAALILLTVATVLAKPYVSPKGYQITPPAGWHTNSKGLMGTDLAILAAPSDGFRANLNVILRPLPHGMGIQQLRAGVNLELQTLSSYKQMSQSYTSVGGASGLSTLAEHESNPTLYMHQVSVIKNGAIYTFTCTALASNHKKYDAPFAAMLKSIKWHAPKAT